MSGLKEETVAGSESIFRNPFWVLGASMRDDNSRIMEIAEEGSLRLDDETCRRALADLITPRLRLAAEMGWLPGVSPAKAQRLIASFRECPLQAADDQGLPTLVRANLTAAAFESRGNTPATDVSCLTPQQAAAYILTFCKLVDEMNPGEVLRDINEDRAISGFSEIRSSEQIETEWENLKRRYQRVVKLSLDRMSPAALVATMAEAVKIDTQNGQKHGTTFLADLVDTYQDETKSFLRDEIQSIDLLLTKARETAIDGAAAVAPLVLKIDGAVTNWLKVAEPIQLSLKSRGIEHDLSQQLAYSVRGLGVDLYNQHGMFDEARRLTTLLLAFSASVPEVAAKITEDADALLSIENERKKAVRDAAEWAEKVTYQTEIGLVMKDKLEISPDGIVIRGRRYALASVSRVRWGATKHSVNGIPTGTTYTIAIGDNQTETELTLRDGTKYQRFLDPLWQAVCVRLMSDMLVTLRDGKQVTFGDMVFTDLGVTLTKHKFLGSERVTCDWMHIKVWSAGGFFFIGSADDKKVYSSSPYLKTPNVHLIEHLVRLLFKKPAPRLSSLLGG